MPFLAPALPIIGKAALGLGSSLLGNKLAKSKNTDQAQDALNMTQQSQREATAGGKNLLALGTTTTQPVLNYWSSILSGNRGQMASALAPEASQISHGYQQAANTSAALMPRGGPSASFLGELPFQQQRDVSSLFQSARPQAASQLGGLGMNLLSHGTNLIQASTGAGRGILEQQQQQKLLEAERGKSIGAGLFDILQKYGFDALDKMLKRGGGGSSGGTDITADVGYGN